MSVQSSPTSRPLPAIYVSLAYAGVLPFALGTIVLVAGAGAQLRALAERGLIGYGAVVLAFLGAVHWGVMLARGEPPLRRVLVGGVLPTLVGWVALMVPSESALAIEIVGFGIFWLYEHRVLGPRVLPEEYLALRRMLTLSVCALLTLALIGGR